MMKKKKPKLIKPWVFQHIFSFIDYMMLRFRPEILNAKNWHKLNKYKSKLTKSRLHTKKANQHTYFKTTPP